MKDRLLSWTLWAYTLLIFVFVFAPIFFSVVFSFNSARFPTIPLESFTWHWYETIWKDPDVWVAVRNSVVVSLCTSVIATLLGFCTAYTDYRYNFRFKPLSHRIAMKLAPRRMHRDISRMQHALIANGRAVWLGERFPPDNSVPPPDDLERASRRVRALFE